MIQKISRRELPLPVPPFLRGAVCKADEESNLPVPPSLREVAARRADGRSCRDRTRHKRKQLERTQAVFICALRRLGGAVVT